MILVKEFLNRLKLDFSNIEEVYSDSLNEYNVNNIDKTEVIFIDSFDFDGIEQSENLSKLSEYLEEKRNKVEWYNIDFYNHYIKTGRFAFSVLFNYQDNEFDKVCDLLLKYKEQYDYIFELLTDNRKIKFKYNFCNKLEKLKAKQTIDVFIHIIDDLQKKINNEFLIFNTNKESQQTEAKQHPNFDPNLWNNDCYELFKYLYDCYYKSTNRQLTNIWFYLKESGKNKKYILKATKEQYKDFINKNYKIKIKNFDKAQTKWEDKEYQTLDDHRKNFDDILKQIAENAKNT